MHDLMDALTNPFFLIAVFVIIMDRSHIKKFQEIIDDNHRTMEQMKRVIDSQRKQIDQLTKGESATIIDINSRRDTKGENLPTKLN